MANTYYKLVNRKIALDYITGLVVGIQNECCFKRELSQERPQLLFADSCIKDYSKI